MQQSMFFEITIELLRLPSGFHWVYRSRADTLFFISIFDYKNLFSIDWHAFVIGKLQNYTLDD